MANASTRWNMGAACSHTSPECSLISRAAPTACASTTRCVSTTAFGTPVVPLVKYICAANRSHIRQGTNQSEEGREDIPGAGTNRRRDGRVVILRASILSLLFTLRFLYDDSRGKAIVPIVGAISSEPSPGGGCSSPGSTSIAAAASALSYANATSRSPPFPSSASQDEAGAGGTSPPTRRRERTELGPEEASTVEAWSSFGISGASAISAAGQATASSGASSAGTKAGLRFTTTAPRRAAA
eukprot:402341-Pyramimonas_sp.AAC.1